MSKFMLLNIWGEEKKKVLSMFLRPFSDPKNPESAQRWAATDQHWCPRVNP